MTTRRCARPGCPHTLASQRARWCSDACRKRAERERRAGQEPGLPGQPDTLTASVEVLVEQFPTLAPPLAAALRTLAAQLDAHPDRSPLWGRFATLLEAALEAWSRAQPLDADAAALTGELHGCRDPQRHGEGVWRHCSLCCHGDEQGALQALRGRLMREAAERPEDDPQRYRRLVPVGCAEGTHRPSRWPAGATTCEDCGLMLDDGEGGILAQL